MTKSLDAQRSRSIGRLNARISAHINRELSARGIAQLDSPAQKSVLINLEEGGNRITELAKRLRITKQAVSKLVQELESKNLVERVSDPDDGRASIIVFTVSGRQIVTHTLDFFSDLEEMIAHELGSDELELMRNNLKKVATLLDPEGF